MSIKIGIPRALYYYQYYSLWKSFFEELGTEVIVSDRTTKRILENGVKTCIDEACLPVKLFHGHVLELINKVDYLFIPRLTSVSKDEYVCPKIGGLPDMVRHTIKNLPQIIDTEVNMRKSVRNCKKAVLEIGGYITSNKRKIMQAYDIALMEYYRNKKLLMDGSIYGNNPGEKSCRTIKNLFDSGRDSLTAVRSLNIAVIGHVYNIYDNYINMNLMKKLKENGANIITIDMIEDSVIDRKSAMLSKRIFWNFGRKAIGSAFHLIDRKDIDGIVFLMSFGCGVDSFVCDLIERKIRREKDIPFMVITLDEHSGEAGLNTRIEALIDMLQIKASKGMFEAEGLARPVLTEGEA